MELFSRPLGDGLRIWNVAPKVKNSCWTLHLQNHRRLDSVPRAAGSRKYAGLLESARGPHLGTPAVAPVFACSVVPAEVTRRPSQKTPQEPPDPTAHGSELSSSQDAH